MTLYKGPAVNILWYSHGGSHHAAAASSAASDQHWATGTIMLFSCIVGWSAFFIVQVYMFSITIFLATFYFIFQSILTFNLLCVCVCFVGTEQDIGGVPCRAVPNIVSLCDGSFGGRSCSCDNGASQECLGYWFRFQTSCCCLFCEWVPPRFSSISSCVASMISIERSNGFFFCVWQGIVCSGIAYYMQSVVNKSRGPVFVTAFSPLSMIITAVLAAIVLAEQVHLGRYTLDFIPNCIRILLVVSYFEILKLFEN